MTNDRTILITGVTGQQGGAVAHALQGTGFQRSRYLKTTGRTWPPGFVNLNSSGLRGSR